MPNSNIFDSCFPEPWVVDYDGYYCINPRFYDGSGELEYGQEFTQRFTNPIYHPQLAFRTPVAMLVGGIFGILLTTIFSKIGSKRFFELYSIIPP
ncbi:hypothetical protein [Sphingobacterium cavernae]|uniref:hypothetical protein n=1 Tax=Sphingobacterium cavernae TaxID=2592657 RepID=UPI001666538E|nr:hypothetical protein [Sphingobacterium cavernae]